MNLLSPRERRIQGFFQTKSACRGGNTNESGQTVASCENDALEKQENQMVVKHRQENPSRESPYFPEALGHPPFFSLFLFFSFFSSSLQLVV